MRRARIKAVANLSTARRPAAKTTYNENTEKPCDAGNQMIASGENAADSSLDVAKNVPIDAAENKDPEPDHEISRAHNQNENQQVSPVPTTFKTPLQIPRNDHTGPATSQPSADKSRRFKIAPRLNVSRSVVVKSHVITILSKLSVFLCTFSF